MQYIELQTPNNQHKIQQLPLRRENDTHVIHRAPERNFPSGRRTFGVEHDDVPNVETPLMKNPHETVVRNLS